MTGSKRRLLSAAYIAALALLLARLPRLGDPQDLDCGWQSMLHDDFVRGAQSGVDTVFTYGPLGWVFAEAVYAPAGLWTFALASLLAGLALAAAMWSAAAELPGRWRAAWLTLLLLLGPFLGGAAPFVAIAALGVACARRPTWPRAITAVLLFAALGLVKFSWLALGAATIASLASGALLQRRWRTALAWPLAALVAVLLCWIASGQHLANLPTWWHGALQITAGYNDAMAAARDDGELRSALALLALLAVFAIATSTTTVGTREVDPPVATRITGCAIVGALLLLPWKAGFVRQDESHTVMFFGAASTAPFLLLAAIGPIAVPRALAAFALSLVVGATVPLVHAAHAIPATSPLRDAWQRAIAVARLPAHLRELETAIAAQRRTAPLPRLAAAIDAGKGDADMMGCRQGLALASGIALRHRPVFQSYSAYTPWLQQRNGEFWRAATAPRHALVHVSPLGNHLPTAEDSDSWRALLDGYEPIAAERDVLLLRRRASAPAVTTRPVLQRRIALDEWIELPTDADRHDLALEIGSTWLGRAGAALLRPAKLLLELRLRDGTTLSRAIAPAMVKAPFVVDPLIRDSRDFLAAITRRGGVRVAAFRVRGDADAAHHGDAGITATVTATTVAAEPITDDLATRLDLALQFPGFDLLPTAIEPAGAARTIGNGELGVRVAVPSRLAFSWPGGRRRIEVQFELLAESYRGAVRSDGARFRVAIAAAGETPSRVAAERLLQPAALAEDRGVHTLAVELDLPADTAIELVVDAGPAGRAQYDFAAWQRVTLFRP